MSSYLRYGLCDEKLLRHLTSVGLYLVTTPDLTVLDMALLAGTFSKALDARQLDSESVVSSFSTDSVGLRGPARYWAREVLNQAQRSIHARICLAWTGAARNL